MLTTFEQDLEDLINRHNAEDASGTPDYILAAYLRSCLMAFNEAVSSRAEWRGESCGLPGTRSETIVEPEMGCFYYDELLGRHLPVRHKHNHLRMADPKGDRLIQLMCSLYPDTIYFIDELR